MPAPAVTQAQSELPVPFDSRLDRELDERPALPEFERERRPLLPPAPELPPVPARASAGIEVFVRGISLTGNTVFSDKQLAQVTGPYEGRKITTEELLELRDEITRYYAERGYVNSGAIIPDQGVADGIVVVEIVEGKLDEVQVGGLDMLREGFLEGRIRDGAGQPLNLNRLQERLQLLLADPSVARLDARLVPGTDRGQSRLEVDVVEASRFTLDFEIDNERSPSVGEPRAALAATARNVFGYSDPLFVRLGLTEGLRDAALAYSVPFTPGNSRLRFYLEASDSDVVEEPFDELDIMSQTYTAEVGVRFPLAQTLDRELTVGVDLSRRRSETELLGRPFSFSPGVQDGRSDVTALRFPVDYLRRDRDRVVALRSILSVGLDAFGATANPGDTPDGEFVAWLGQAQLAQRFGSSQLILRADVQLAEDPLLPIEQLAIGGLDTVRGYRENLLVRDNGVILSIEGRLPLFQLPLPRLGREGRTEGWVQLAPFIDFGRAWDTDDNSFEGRSSETIKSLGVGLLWAPSSRIAARLYYGYALDDDDFPDPEEHSLQDDGIHFEARFGLL